MLVIKMLKKASNMNNIELAEYLGKTRNTIAAWENDEGNIPNTEKVKLSNRFEFNYEYWNVGLDQTNTFYQKMYSDIKNGFLKDSERQRLNNESRIDEILKHCDGTNGMIDCYRMLDKSNEYNHYQYINSLLNGRDPIDNSLLDDNHFINDYRECFKDFNNVFYKFDDLNENNIEEVSLFDEFYINYLNRLKVWRRIQAEIEDIKPFQVLSDEVLENIVKAYKSNNTKLSGIKNFPVGGIKWNKYYEILISILEGK